MNDQEQPYDESTPQWDDTEEPGRPDGHDRDDGRPQADPVLTKRFEELDKALNGPKPARPQGQLNWSGIDNTTAVFESIADALNESIPPDRPSSDLPDNYGDVPEGS